MNKLTFYSLVLILVLSACSNHSEHQELLKLRKENIALKKKLDSYDQAVIITRDNIEKYVGSLAGGPNEVKKNEEILVNSYLYLHTLPLKVDCTMDQENQSVEALGQIGRSIRNTFPGSGERIFTGKYTVTFPNGEEWSVPWEKRVMVK